ncbi:MAG: sigma 54-interacting transcriptional regulator, partial [Deltaproteobacteria bacterium]
IHASSGRNKMPFVSVNCGGVQETLIETELFGHEAGAFTGAIRARQGRFARAEGGTLFLDEIGDLPLPLQTKLLRVLQNRNYEPLGGTRSLSANVRIITATNRDLEKMVADGTFRQDLFFRINVIKLEIPPLRERLEDVPLLVDHFISRFSALHRKHIEAISHEALDVLMRYDYPGNIRELENIIEHGYVLSPGGLIHVKHLPDSLRPTLNSFVRADTFEEMERQFIIFMLKKNKWNRLAAAREMGIHKTTLFRKIKRLGIRLPDKDREGTPLFWHV